MLVPIENAGMLQQTRHEREGAFAISDLEIELLILVVKARFDVRDAVLLQHLARDFGDGAVLVDSAIDAVGQEGEPRHNLGAPRPVALERGVHQREPADMAMQRAFVHLRRVVQPQRHRLAHQRPHLGVGRLGGHLDRVDVAARKHIDPVNSQQQHDVRAEWRIDRDPTCELARGVTYSPFAGNIFPDCHHSSPVTGSGVISAI